MKLLSAILLVLWSCLVCNVQQSCANHWPPTPEKALVPVLESGSFSTPDSILTDFNYFFHFFYYFFIYFIFIFSFFIFFSFFSWLVYETV